MDLNNVGKVREFRRAGRSDKLNRMIEEAQLKIEEQSTQAFGAFQHNSVGSGFKVTNRAIEDNEYNRGSMGLRKGWHPSPRQHKDLFEDIFADHQDLMNWQAGFKQEWREMVSISKHVHTYKPDGDFFPRLKKGE